MSKPTSPEVEPREPIVLLDCTLRDGGYYNDWDFSTSLIQRYLNAMSVAGIPVVELGFRSRVVDRYMGPVAYTTDDFLASLELPGAITLGVMCNAKELVSDDRPREAVDELFTRTADSPISMVRIASNLAELEPLSPAVDRLLDLGYRVGVNLMQASNRTTAEFARFGALAEEWGIELAYFADSFGGLRGGGEIAHIISAIREAFGGVVGCHMHDNMSLAFANSLLAVDAGATWVDGTLRGMGRGPGNARTEYLAIELTGRGQSEVNYLPLLELVLGDFAELHREYGWGSNPYYFLSAARGVHPTYIQEMTRDGRYTADEIVVALEELGSGTGASFSQVQLDSAASPPTQGRAEGTWSATGWCSDRDVLIVGPGPSGQERRGDIERYIDRVKPIVIGLNVRPPVAAELVDAYVVSHPVRAVIDADEIGRLSRPVFMPSSVRERVGAVPPGLDVRDYGMRVSSEGFVIEATECSIPRLEAAAYAMSVAAAGGAKRILLTGFDGFGRRDPRHEAMESIFAAFQESPSTPPVVSLTRTSYSISTSSLFAHRDPG